MFTVGGVHHSDENEIDLFALGAIEKPGTIDSAATIEGSAIVIINAPFPTLLINAESGFVADISLSAPIPKLSIVAEILLEKKVIIGRKWFCTITGAADGLLDLIVPLSSINGKLRQDGVHSYIIVIPDGQTYSNQISSRSNGNFIIDSEEIYSDGTSAMTQSVKFNIQTIVPDQGANRFSVSIRGTSSVANTTPKKLNVFGVSFSSTGNDGKRRIRCENNKDFLQGDTAILPDGGELIAGLVTLSISATNQYMQLTEQ